jgi:fucose permease
MAIASVFATCINFAQQRMPLPSQVMAVFMVGGSLGSMTLPWLAGQLFDRRGPETLIWLVGGAIVAALALFMWIRARAPRVTTAAGS